MATRLTFDGWIDVFSSGATSFQTGMSCEDLESLLDSAPLTRAMVAHLSAVQQDPDSTN